jgi:hypothetical protein
MPKAESRKHTAEKRGREESNEISLPHLPLLANITGTVKVQRSHSRA